MAPLNPNSTTVLAGSSPVADSSPADSNPVAEALLRWYAQHKRALPWRDSKADPYRVWLSEIMLQQTTVKAVIPYFEKFTGLWPDIRALAAAPDEDVMRAWAGLGYYSRARNLLACARQILDHHQGQFPAHEEDLRRLPGIGTYTAAAISAIAFGRRAVVVDGNVERVVSRLHALEQALPAGRAALRRLADALTPTRQAGDFAQAMMDLGATLCTPRQPACPRCPLAQFCQARLRDPQSFPRKAAKPARPTRYGAVYIVTRPDGALALRRRPPRGLLANMTELPTTDWVESAQLVVPLAQFATAQELGTIRHVFTHFALELRVFLQRLPQDAPCDPYRWCEKAAIAEQAWPSLMRKALTCAEPHLQDDDHGR